jgi:uncharacterized protein with FMN-binding domain
MNTQSTLVGLFKETYGDSIVEAWSFMAKIANKAKFVRRELQPGNFYNQPVDLQFEAGITAAAAGVVPGIGGAPFLPPIAGQMQNAQLAGAQLIGRSSVSYESIARSANDKAAFKSSTEAIVRRLSRTTTKHLELQLLHGRQGLGTISVNPANGATRTVVISDATWASGIWAGLIGSTLDLYNAAGVKQNTGATSTSNAITIASVNTATKSITLTVPAAADQTLNLANLLIFFETASPASEMIGLHSIASTTSASSTLFNINPAVYDLWCSNQIGSVGTLSFDVLLEAMSLIASYDFDGEACAVVSPKGFEVLNSDQAALRMYDASYSGAKATNGSNSLKFNAQTGSIEVLSHAFEKEGQALVFVPAETIRVGASDVGFITRQGSEDKLILESATSAGSEMRCYSNQSVFSAAPRHMCNLTDITA